MAQPWDNSNRTSTHSATGMSQQQQLPSISNITNGVPGPNVTSAGEPSPLQTPTGQTATVRDSGNWSMQSPSSHSSIISMASNPIQLPPLEPNRTSPNRNSLGPNDASPFTASFTSAPPSAGLQQQSPMFNFNNGYGQPDTSQPRPSSEFPSADSRRSSFDARLGNLNLSSPLGSNNASQVSLTSTLQSKRGIPLDGPPRTNGLGTGRPPFGGYSHGSGSSVVPGRTAPPINPSSRFPFPHPNAPSPTKGFPYAFPDPEVASQSPPSARSMERSTLSLNSRNGSVGGSSLANSTFTSASATPSQRRLHDDPSSSEMDHRGAPNGNDNGQRSDYSRPASLYDDGRDSTDLTGVNQHHHHQLHNKQLTGLIGEPGSPCGSATTPYSRTPELRVSHKLAERKRRKEMKDLFDELRDILPHERGGRSSKWEVLTQAVEYVHSLKTYQNHMQRELEVCRRDAQNSHILQQEVNSLRMQMQAMQTQQQQQQQQPGPFQANGASAPPPGQGHSHQPVTLPPPPSMMEY